MAAASGRTEIASLLITAGANVNAVDKYGKTALMRAAENGYTKIVQMLKDTGAVK